MSVNPYIITLSKNSTKEGLLSFIEESEDLPIEIKRVYWIYDVSNDAERGNHAHLNSDRIMVCLQGKVEISIENIRGDIYSFILQDPGQALYFPRNHWIKLTITQGSVLVVMASCMH